MLLAIVGLWGSGVPGEAQFGDPPDLVVEAFSVDPFEPEPEDLVELIVKITNEGRGQVVQPFSVFFEVDGELAANVRVTSRPRPGRQVEVRGRWTAVEGTHRVVVRVDAFDEVEESDERNNRVEKEIEVRKLEGVRSITLELFEGVASGLRKAGQAIQVEHNSDLFQLFEAFKAAAETAGEALSGGAERLELRTAGLPSVFQQEAQVLTSGQIANLYRSMAASFSEAMEGLERLNLQLLITAFEKIQSDLETLAALSIEGVSLAELSATIVLMDQALAEAERLQAAAEGGEEVDVEGATQELLDVLSQIGAQWESTADGFAQSGSASLARFTTVQGNPVKEYRATEELVIAHDRAQRLRWEIFRETGELVFSAESEGAQLRWRGVDSSGRALPPGRYYYRLTAVDGRGTSRVELGQIILSG
jgi:hypothetical protein